MEYLSPGRSHRLAWLLAVVSLVLLSACGDNDDAPAATGATAGETDHTLAAEQVLRLSMNSEPGTIDPHLSSVGNEVSIARQLSSGLFAYDEDLNIVPALAATIPTVGNGGISEDGLTYTIELQVTSWSDGSPLTAEDFVYSMLRALDPQVASPFAWAFYDIVGAFDYNTSLETDEGAPAPPASEIDDLRAQVGVRAEGDYTVVYTLEAPNPSFLNLLALVTAFPVKQGVVEEHGDAWTDPRNFVGNGPFLLSNWERGSRLVLDRNEDWYGPMPTLSRLEVGFIADDGVAYNAYVNDELHAVRATTAALASGAHADELVVTPELGTYALFMNNAKEPFDNPLIRQAFGSAIDRDAYVNAVLQGAGQATTSWVPPGMPGYSDTLGFNITFDPEGAQELLSDAGYAGGEGLPGVTFVMIASDYNNLVGQFIEDQLGTNLGVEVRFEFFDQGQYFDLLFDGEFDATIQSWFADWPYPDNFLYGPLHSQGGANFIGFSNPDFDQLLDDAALAVDPETRLEFYLQAQEILLADAGLAPLYNETNNTYVKPSVLDLVVTGIDGALKGDNFFWKTKIIVPSSN